MTPFPTGQRGVTCSIKCISTWKSCNVAFFWTDPCSQPDIHSPDKGLGLYCVIKLKCWQTLNTKSVTKYLEPVLSLKGESIFLFSLVHQITLHFKSYVVWSSLAMTHSLRKASWQSSYSAYKHVFVFGVCLRCVCVHASKE